MSMKNDEFNKRGKVMMVHWFKARKKPLVIEAFQLKISMLTTAELDDLPITGIGMFGFQVKTPDGNMSAKVGDYIIKGIDGKFYTCKKEIFKKTYDLIN